MGQMKHKTTSASLSEQELASTNGGIQSAEDLYNSASEYAQQSQPELAIEYADKLWSVVKTQRVEDRLPALVLRGEILVELAEISQAQQSFEAAAELDPEGTIEGPTGAGAEKFMWLAQLSEDGGEESLRWYTKGIEILQQQVSALDAGEYGGLDAETLLILRAQKKARLANALCSVIELYMTDLSWDEDAEERCEQLITQALTVEDETSPEVLQTLASVRISQDRHDDARAALERSYASWKDLDADDDAIPDFAARISLARLLMETDMRSEALEVVTRLISEDDESVEAWYLGGWCSRLVAEDIDGKKGSGALTDEQTLALDHALKRSRRWLNQSVKLFDQLDYEDYRLRDHALELLQELESILGPQGEDEDESDDSDDDEWQGLAVAETNGDGDHEMEDA